MPWEVPLRVAAADEAGLAAAATLLAEALRVSADGRPGEAARLLRGLRRSALADWAGVFEAGSWADAGDPGPVEAALARVPPDLVAMRGWDARMRVRVAGGAAADAVELARSARAAIADPGGRDALDVAVARLALARGDTALARATLLGVLEAVRSGGPAGGTVRGAGAAALLDSLGATSGAEYRALVAHHARRGALGEARRTLAAMRADPAVEPADLRRAALDEAVASSDRRDGGGAVDRLLALAGQGAEPDVRASALLAAGRARLRQGRTRDAASLLGRSVDADPAGPAAQEALLHLADLDQDAGRHESARERFARAMAVDPASEWGGEAAARLGALLYRQGDDLGAAAVFEAYREAWPDGWRFQQATFWAGLAYRRMGEGAAAHVRFAEADSADPVGYYGMRAREVRGIPMGVDDLDPGPPALVDDARLARGGRARIEALRSAGLADVADVERLRLRRLMASRIGGLHALAESYLDAGHLVEAARVGREARAQAGRWDLRLLRSVFPLPYRDEILRSAAHGDVDPALLAALIRQESLFQPGAVSVAGAVGLMQLQPRTARELAARAGMRGAPDLRDPDVNLTLGSLFLGDLLRRNGRRLDDVLVAYNAGPGRLARWRSFPEHADPDQFLERIPYRETREYVRVVRESIPVYTLLHGGEAPRPRAPFTP